MKEEWLFSGAFVPADAETTAALVAEIKRLIDVVGGMALTQRPWVGLTEQQIKILLSDSKCWGGEDCSMPNLNYIVRAVEKAHGIGE